MCSAGAVLCQVSLLFLRRRISVRAQFLKDFVERSCAGQQDRHCNLAVIEESAKCVEIAIECLILTVPLKIESNLALHIIDLVRIGYSRLAASLQLDIKLLFLPSERPELTRQRFRNLAFIASGFLDEVYTDAKGQKHIANLR